MEGFKGTKGKWYISRQCDGLSVHSKRSPAGIDIICKVKDQFHKEDTEANAQLISKAPEMLESMQSFIDDFEGDYVVNGEIVDDPTDILIVNYNKFKSIVKSTTEINEDKL